MSVVLQTRYKGMCRGNGDGARGGGGGDGAGRSPRCQRDLLKGVPPAIPSERNPDLAKCTAITSAAVVLDQLVVVVAFVGGQNLEAGQGCCNPPYPSWGSNSLQQVLVRLSDCLPSCPVVNKGLVEKLGRMFVCALVTGHVIVHAPCRDRQTTKASLLTYRLYVKAAELGNDSLVTPCPALTVEGCRSGAPIPVCKSLQRRQP